MPTPGGTHDKFWIADGVGPLGDAGRDLPMLGVGRGAISGIIFLPMILENADPLIWLGSLLIGGIAMASNDWGVRSLFARKTAKKSDGERRLDYVNSKDGLIAKLAIQKTFKNFDPDNAVRGDFSKRFEHAYGKASNTGTDAAGLRLRMLLYYWYGRLHDVEW